MIEGRDIVCLSFVTWDDHWGTPQQLLSRLPGSNRILYVDQPISPLSLFTGLRKRGAVLEQFRRWRRGPRQVAPNIWAAAPPPVLPLRYHKPVNMLNAWLLRRWLRAQARALGLSRPLFWNFQPSLPGVGRAVDPVLQLYHCVDEFSAVPHWWHPGASVRAREVECLHEADAVVCTGRTLVEGRRELNSNIHFVGNAGNYALFSRASSPETRVPDEMRRLPGTVVGMLGVLDFRLDAGLIERMATVRPDWSFALCGLVKGDAPLERLRALPNVHVLGFKPMEDLPGYLKGMDVCLIPYALNAYTHHIFPLKLYDYMAAGKPIVAADMAEIRPDDGRGFTIAHTPEEFVAAVERALISDSPEAVLERQELARQNSWEHRVQEISKILEPMLEARAPAATSAGAAEVLAG